MRSNIAHSFKNTLSYKCKRKFNEIFNFKRMADPYADLVLKHGVIKNPRIS